MAKKRTTKDPAVLAGGNGPVSDYAQEMSARSSGESRESEAPGYDEIAQEAYRRYLQRGGDHGHDFDDWLEAERELRSRR